MNFCTLWLGAPASQMVQKHFHRQSVSGTIFIGVWDLLGFCMASTQPWASRFIRCQEAFAWCTQSLSCCLQLCHAFWGHHCLMLGAFLRGRWRGRWLALTLICHSCHQCVFTSYRCLVYSPLNDLYSYVQFCTCMFFVCLLYVVYIVVIIFSCYLFNFFIVSFL